MVKKVGFLSEISRTQTPKNKLRVQKELTPLQVSFNRFCKLVSIIKPIETWFGRQSIDSEKLAQSPFAFFVSPLAKGGQASVDMEVDEKSQKSLDAACGKILDTYSSMLNLLQPDQLKKLKGFAKGIPNFAQSEFSQKLEAALKPENSRAKGNSSSQPLVKTSKVSAERMQGNSNFKKTFVEASNASSGAIIVGNQEPTIEAKTNASAVPVQGKAAGEVVEKAQEIVVQKPKAEETEGLKPKVSGKKFCGLLEQIIVSDNAELERLINEIGLTLPIKRMQTDEIMNSLSLMHTLDVLKGVQSLEEGAGSPLEKLIIKNILLKTEKIVFKLKQFIAAKDFQSITITNLAEPLEVYFRILCDKELSGEEYKRLKFDIEETVIPIIKQANTYELIDLRNKLAEKNNEFHAYSFVSSLVRNMALAPLTQFRAKMNASAK